LVSVRGDAQSSRIAVLGWGSLLKRPKRLSLKTRWRNDGPSLPIEFARISGDEHLTLVIVPGRQLVRTYWALSGCGTAEQAVEDLAKREGTPAKNIGFLLTDGRHSARFPRYIPRLRAWLRMRGFDGVVWTDLPSNFEERSGITFSNDAAIKYLASATPAARAAATDYVRIAPVQTNTRLRARLEKELGLKKS
jgi:hypothetical protein